MQEINSLLKYNNNFHPIYNTDFQPLVLRDTS